MADLRLGRRTVLFVYRGFAGIQLANRQIDITNHRKHPPPFSVRELGHPCGHHLGRWCLRTRQLRRPTPTTSQETTS